MVRVAGLWELGWNTPIKEAELWEYPLRDFGVERWFMTPVSGIVGPFVVERCDLCEVIDEHRAENVSVVFVDERGLTPLRRFDHPPNVLYVFGKTSLNPLTAYGKPGDASVVIETQHRLGALWAHQAATLVLYDRMVKTWR